jgi:hypothetical protein
MTTRTATERPHGFSGGAKLAFAALALVISSTACDDDQGGGLEDAGSPSQGSDASAGDDASVPGEDAGAMDAGPGLDASTGSDASTGADASTGSDAGEDGGTGKQDAGEDSGTGEQDGGQALVCNGAAELCDRAFDEIAFPSTHNAMSASEEGFINSDQRYGIEKQLADGIRAMELDVWKYDPDGTGDEPEELYLCHSHCEDISEDMPRGRRKLAGALQSIAEFLATHPHDVLTLLFEDHVLASDLLPALDAAGLFDQLHLQGPHDQWPTLREMINANTRLVALFEDQGGQTEPYPTGYQVTWDYAWDTDWSLTMPSDLDDPNGKDCEPLKRGHGHLFIFNHDLDTDTQAEDFAKIINLKASLLTRAQKCWDKKGQIPNFVKVDYYDIGDLFSVCRTLNGLDN